MINILITDKVPEASSEPGHYALWNIDRRVFRGSTGVEVMLVQFYLAMENIVRPTGMFFGDIDGIWGPHTDDAMDKFENQHVATSQSDGVAPDGVVDPMPPPGFFLRQNNMFLYKLHRLGLNYCTLKLGREITRSTFNTTLMSMATDPACPPGLRVALDIALGNLSASDIELIKGDPLS